MEKLIDKAVLYALSGNVISAPLRPSIKEEDRLMAQLFVEKYKSLFQKIVSEINSMERTNSRKEEIIAEKEKQLRTTAMENLILRNKLLQDGTKELTVENADSQKRLKQLIAENTALKTGMQQLAAKNIVLENDRDEENDFVKKRNEKLKK